MIERFISQVKTKGLARTNRFLVEIPGMGRSSDDAEMLSLFCETVSLPGLSLATTPQRIYGEVREMPYEKIYDTVNLSFYVDSDMNLKLMFDNWIHSTIDPRTRQSNYYHNYVRDVRISVLPVDSDTPVYTVTLREAYPKAVGTVQMDAAARDVMKLPVTLNYKFHNIDVPDTTLIENRRFINSPQDRQGVITGTGYEVDQYVFYNSSGFEST